MEEGKKRLQEFCRNGGYQENMAHWMNGLTSAHRDWSSSQGNSRSLDQDCMLWLLSCNSCRTSQSSSRCFSYSFDCCWDYFPAIELPCPASISGLLPCRLESYFVLFDSGFLEACFFPKKKMERMWIFGKVKWGDDMRKGSRKYVVWEKKLFSVY